MSRGRSFVLVFVWSLVFLWISVIHCMWEQIGMGSFVGIPNLFDRLCMLFVQLVGEANAVFAAFGILGMLVSHAFARHGMHGAENGRHSIFLCMLFAVSEEVYQLLVPGHGFSLVELTAYGIAAMMGVFLYSLLTFLGRRIQYKNQADCRSEVQEHFR